MWLGSFLWTTYDSQDIVYLNCVCLVLIIRSVTLFSYIVWGVGDGYTDVFRAAFTISFLILWNLDTLSGNLCRD